MNRTKEYYQVLGVNKNAPPDEIKKKYRKLALKYHPDRNKGNSEAEERFKEINEAYAVLSDPEKKKQYDMFGSAKFHQRFNQEDIFRGFDIGDILKDFGFSTDDVFSSMFGRQRGRQRTYQRRAQGPFGAQGGPFQDIFGASAQRPAAGGADLSLEVTITLEEAAKGISKTISLKRRGKREKLAVKIPAGTAEGKKLRLARKGEPGPQGTPPGNLYITVHVQPHPLFRREGDDTYLEQEIRVSQALLGTTVEVPTLLDGPRRLRVPPGTQAGTRIRLRGLGLPHMGKESRGDAYVSLKVSVPKKLNEQQKKLVEELAREGL